MAVLPFENATGDPANDVLGDGISESLINKLSTLPGLRVISRRSAFAFKGQRLGPAEIGAKLGVDALLLGSLAQRGARLAISAELVSVRDDSQLWGEKYARSADDVLEVAERRIADGGAPLSRAWLGATYAVCGEPARARQKLEELHALSKERYVDPSTYADIHASLGEIDEALRCYERAWEDRTPNMAYASIASRINPQLAGNPQVEAIVRRMNFPEPKR